MSVPVPSAPNSHGLVMHLSVPAEGRLRGIARELATRVAEHLGAPGPDAQAVGEAVEGLASRLANGGQADRSITFEFRQARGELVIEGRCSGEATEVRHPLPA
jgi:hypothetical protein